MSRCMTIIVTLVFLTVLAQAEEPLRPSVVLSGSDSAIQKPEMQRITKESAWATLWNRHVAQLERIKSERPVAPEPQVDFEKFMIIAIFDGSTWNTAGLRFVTAKETETEVVLGLDWRTYQTRGDGHEVTPYGFLVLPRTTKALRIQLDVRGLPEYAADAPPKWKDIHTFPAMESGN
jgi:hypothetical protein